MKLLLLLICFFIVFPPNVNAAFLEVPNNKFGIHIINPVTSEAESAANLVNSNGGDWGYVTFVIPKNDRNNLKWQNFFNELKRLHLIPIVRLATQTENDYWTIPQDNDAKDWAEFLNNLSWPIKNRYVVIYNEPNNSKEWGNKINPAEYAQVLDKTIASLKEKSSDFFVLNAGFDQSAPQKMPSYSGEENFLREVNLAVPGIFNKLDGWVSHSYPNPGFSGSPDDSGRGSVEGYLWELDLLKGLGLEKELPVFITETGWQHAQGEIYNRFLPDEETVAHYYETAFSSAWNDRRVFAVTPFILDYTYSPFDHFSFKKSGSLAQLGGAANEFYAPFYKIASIVKETGKPVMNKEMKTIPEEKPPIIVQEESSIFEKILTSLREFIGL